MKRLYDWGVATETAGKDRTEVVGVSDQERRARDQMVQALRTVPAGVAAVGWVTVMSYVPKDGSYQRHGFAMRAERDARGEVQLLAGHCDG